jgi:hypothetical protein
MTARPRAFGVRRIEEEPPPLVQRHVLSRKLREAAESPSSSRSPVTVFVQKDVHEALSRTRSFSREIEEGGFLLGRVYRDAEAPSMYLVSIVEALAATGASGTAHELVFSPDSFAAAQRRVVEGGDDVTLVGWYHTHLVAAAEDEALSMVDRDLHASTFRKRWQVAALVTLHPARDPEARGLSFFALQGGFMVRCPGGIAEAIV